MVLRNSNCVIIPTTTALSVTRSEAIALSVRSVKALNMREIFKRLIVDPRYQANIEYGEPRPGHPEGKVKFHIAELESNLEKIRPRLNSEENYWKLKFMIHVHDTFKADAEHDVPVLHPRSHASLARVFANEYINDPDLLNMIQFHDENYALWQQVEKFGYYDQQKFDTLLNSIEDWDLFLEFTIVDGNTVGKDRSKLTWFVREVKKYKETKVDETWIMKET